MKNTFTYMLLGFGAIFLIEVGLIIDRVGGIDIRSDGIPFSMSLSLSDPVMPGVPLTVRWASQPIRNVRVAMYFVSETQVSVVGNGTLSEASMRITIPCTVSGRLARFELRDVSSRAVFASRPVTILPPGPDCVK